MSTLAAQRLRRLAPTAATMPRPDNSAAVAARAAAVALGRENSIRRQAANSPAKPSHPRRTEATAVADGAGRADGMVAFRLSWLARPGVGGGVVAVMTALGDTDLDHPGRGLLVREVVDAFDGAMSMSGVRAALQRGEAAGLVRYEADERMKSHHRWVLVTSPRTVSKGGDRPEAMSQADWDAASGDRQWGAITLAAAARGASGGRSGLAALIRAATPDLYPPLWRAPARPTDPRRDTAGGRTGPETARAPPPPPLAAIPWAPAASPWLLPPAQTANNSTRRAPPTRPALASKTTDTN